MSSGQYGPHQPYPPRPGRPPWLIPVVAGVSVSALVLVLVCGGIAVVAFRAISSAHDRGRTVAQPAPSASASEDPSERLGVVGEPMRLRELEFVVVDSPVCGAGPLPGVAGAPMKPEGQFCRVRVRVRNLTAKPVRWDAEYAWAFTAEADDDAIVADGPAIYAINDDLGVPDIKPTESWTGVTVFDIPADETLDVVEFNEINQKGAVFIECE